MFYGINGHNNYGGGYLLSSPAVQLTQLQDLGIKMYRNEVFEQWSATNLAGVAKTMAAGGITVYPVMLMNIDYPDEQTAYNAAYAFGRQVARSSYEVTNELGTPCLVGWVDGVRPTDFDNQKFQIARGVVRGMIAGIRSVDSTGKIIMGGETWLHYGFDVMLANGTQPDGTSGHPVATWDITTWHWYSEQGNITNACGGTGCFNVLATLKSFGKPIWMTEVGVRPYFPGTQQQAAAYLANDMLGALLVIAPYDIESLQGYELYDDLPGGEGDYGLLLDDGKTPKPQYAAVKNFIAANPP